jgi:hypothetical protein
MSDSRRRVISRRISPWLGLPAVIALSACNPWSTSYDAPPKSEEAVEPKTKTSSIVIPISASLADLQQRLNREIPTTLYAVDENRDACVPAQRARICVLPRPWGGCAQWVVTNTTPAIDCNVKGSAIRGNITIGGADNVLSLSMPVNMSVRVRGRGEIGRHIQETADGAATVNVSAKFDVDENWSPTATVTPSYVWDKTIGIEVFGIRITFGDKVDPKIRDALGSLQAELPSLLAKLDLKAQVEKAWTQGFSVTQLSSNPDAWIRFSPETLGYGGYTVTPGGDLRLSVMVKGKTETFVGKRPEDASPQPLPNLQRELPEPGFEFYLPVSVAYAVLEDNIGKILKLGEEQAFNIPPVGEVKATFSKVQMYQTEDNAIAVGLTLTADPPTGLFDTSGTIWLTAEADVNNERKLLSVNQLGIYGETDSNASDILLSIARFGPIKDALQKAMSYDFSEEYDKGIADANRMLRRQLSNDFFFDGKLDKVTVDRLEGGPSGLILGFSVLGSGELRFGKLPQ